MLEPHLAGIDHLDPHVLQARPVGVQARRQDVAEAAVDPDQGPLVVLQVHDLGAVRERTDLTITSSFSCTSHGVALRDDLDPDLAQRVEEPVPARAEQAPELAVAEVQAHLVAADLERLNRNMVAPPFRNTCGTA